MSLLTYGERRVSGAWLMQTWMERSQQCHLCQEELLAPLLKEPGRQVINQVGFTGQNIPSSLWAANTTWGVHGTSVSVSGGLAH